MAMESDHEWERIGHKEPYYGVLSSERFRSPTLSPDAREAFFASGASHVADVLATVRRRLDPRFRPRRALDFGCGVGRLLIPLSAECEAVVGIDVSESMLAEAKKNLAERGLTNTTLVKSDDRLSRLEGTFDLIHSYIVFQHIPVPRGEAIIESLGRRLNPGGVGVIHVPFHRSASRLRKMVNWARKTLPGVHALVNVAQGRPAPSPHYQMNSYDLRRLHLVLQRNGMDEVFTRLLCAEGIHGVILFFQRPLTDAGAGRP